MQSLVFGYTVAAGEVDADGIAIGANALDLNGAAIVDADDHAAVLTHAAPAAQPGHRVDGVRPAAESAVTTGATLTVTFDEPLGAAASLSNGSFTVQRTRDGAKGDADLAGSPAVSGRTVTLTLAAALEGTDTDVRVSYAKPASGSGNAVVDLAGNAAESFADLAVTNFTRSAARPDISAVTVASRPRLDANNDGTKETYGAGQKIVVDVTWDEAVTWDVSAAGAEVRLRLDVGGTLRFATLQADGAETGSATRLRFAYTVAADDADADGFAVDPASAGNVVTLRLGATLRGAGGVDAGRKHPGLSAGANHKVNGATAAPANRAPVFDDDGNPATDDRDLGAITAPVGILVSREAAGSDFSDPDGDPLTFTTGAARPDAFVGGTPSYINGLLFAQSGNGCQLANLSPPIEVETFVNTATLTASDPEGASVQVRMDTHTKARRCPRFASASVDGTALAITFDGELVHGVPGADEFEVKVDGTAVPLAATGPVSRSGRTITLALASEVTGGQAVTVSYAPDDEALTTRPWAMTAAAVAFTDKTVTNGSAPVLTGVTVSSNPGTDATYGIGDAIELTAAFGGNVTVTTAGNPVAGPRIAFTLGEETRHAVYASGSVGTDLVFRYTVAAGDVDADGIAVAEDALELNGGAIADGNGDAVALAHAALAAQSGHKVDGVRPEVVSASVSGTALTITFDETLGAAASLANGVFTVKRTPQGGTEAGLALGSTAPAVSGKTVTLTLASAVAVSDTAVKVSYAKPTTGSANRIVDAAGNEADGFADQAVANAAPAVTGVTVTSDPGTDATYGIGDAITLTAAFDKNVTVTTAGDPVAGPRIAFTLGAQTKHAVYASGTGTQALAFNYTVAAGDVDADGIAVAADALALEGGTIVDADGSAAALAHAELAAQAGHKVDGVRPTVESASVNGATLTVTFDETLGAAASLANDAFTVKKTGHDDAEVAASLAGSPSVSGATLTLTLAEAAVSTDRDVKVSYAKPGTGSGNALVDAAGNAAADFADRAVANVTAAAGAPCAEDSQETVFPEHLTLTATTSTITVSYADQVALLNQRFQLCKAGASAVEQDSDFTGETTWSFENLDENTDYWVRAKEDTTGFSNWKHVRTLPVLATVTGLEATSDPGTDATYAIGDTVTLTVSFDEDVTVTTAGDPVAGPRLALTLGTETRHAAYASSSDTQSLTFDYTVTEGDEVVGGIAVAANALDLNGGAIADADGNAAMLAHAALAAQPGHKVDGVRPDFESALVDGTTLTVTFDEALGAAASLANDAFTVKRTPQGGTEGTVDLAGSPSVSGRTLTLTLASAVAATDTAVKLSYEKPDSGSGNKLVDAAGNAAADITDRTVRNAAAVPMACGPADPGHFNLRSVTSTSTSISLTVVDGLNGAAAVIVLCGPIGANGAIATANIYSGIDITPGWSFTITHVGPGNTGEALAPDTDYWVRYDGYFKMDRWHYVRTKAAAAAPTFDPADGDTVTDAGQHHAHLRQGDPEGRRRHGARRRRPRRHPDAAGGRRGRRRHRLLGDHRRGEEGHHHRPGRRPRRGRRLRGGLERLVRRCRQPGDGGERHLHRRRQRGGAGLQPGRRRPGEGRHAEHHAQLRRGHPQGRQRRRLLRQRDQGDPDAEDGRRGRHGHRLHGDHRRGEGGHHHRPDGGPGRGRRPRGDLGRLVRRPRQPGGGGERDVHGGRHRADGDVQPRGRRGADRRGRQRHAHLRRGGTQGRGGRGDD